jgi:hypothetical protein
MSVWHWENESKFDPITKTGGLFNAYLDSALKRKQESSGYPAYCDTDEKKDNYINEFNKYEGILLDKQKIAKNSPIRLISKLWSNVLWGYLALDTNRTKFRIINSPDEWQLLLQNDRFEITNVFFHQNNHIQVSYKEREEIHMGNSKTNNVIASFVTAQARLCLYEEIFKLDRNVLYMDT